MQNQTENNKKTWQEPEISQLTVNGGVNAFTTEDPIFHS
jgi:hypothetical protein